MAKVLFVGSNYSFLKTMVQSLGYEVITLALEELQNVSNITKHGHPGEVAFIFTSSFDASANPGLIYVQNLRVLNIDGYCIGVSKGVGSVNYANAHPAYRLGLATGVTRDSTPSTYFISDGADTRLLDPALYGKPIQSSVTYSSNTLIYVKSIMKSNTYSTFFYVEKGVINNIDKKPYGAPLFYTNLFETLSSDSNNYILNFLTDMLEYCIRTTLPTFLINGSVKTVDGTPLERGVSLYSVETKRLLDTSVSDSTTGEYTIGVYKDEKVFAVLQPLGELEAPQVHYNLTLVKNDQSYG